MSHAAKIQLPTKLVFQTVNNINIVKPGKSDQCWAAEIPCTPDIPQNIQLRIPEQGIRGGFRVKISETKEAETKNNF
ncbi:hypothetical protein [Aphanothece sacrum]|uniref:Membrane protein n=1 Tax=Aphanothece sacrum FPU1 TaxID=1920663 RepID=A0A401IKC4_APHSA|nr:hypothetical protein [Aphanothece sacrum]GBF81743.1 membrane protein [Aphanothece sacrum FPU1]GBF85101.1 membrane protein [Aphanothece sacrum FPU3]